jgi:RNA polymerase sigma-70 factor (ECF subfamily)
LKQESTYNNRIFAFLSPEEKMSAFNRLYDEYHHRIFSVVLGMLEDKEIAKDVFQETFVKIWKHMDKYDAGKGAEFTWMYNIARNAVRDTRKSKSYRIYLENRLLECDQNNLIPTFDREYTGISKLTNLLKPEHRILIEMAYFSFPDFKLSNRSVFWEFSCICYLLKGISGFQ